MFKSVKTGSIIEAERVTKKALKVVVPISDFICLGIHF